LYCLGKGSSVCPKLFFNNWLIVGIVRAHYLPS
jgi:hypothetical protein